MRFKSDGFTDDNEMINLVIVYLKHFLLVLLQKSYPFHDVWLTNMHHIKLFISLLKYGWTFYMQFK